MLARAAHLTSTLPSALAKKGRSSAAAAVAAASPRVFSSNSNSNSSSSPDENMKQEPYTARQAKTGRPVSPHVTIYAFPPAALSSIANRVTGVALVVGLYGISGASLVGCDAPALMSALGSSGAGPAVKLAVSFPLVYHYLGAVRHTVWDYVPETLQTAGVAKTSYALLGMSGALSIGLAAI
ncbi:unnamed protein product [Hapterophycus canaliculatus]